MSKGSSNWAIELVYSYKSNRIIGMLTDPQTWNVDVWSYDYSINRWIDVDDPIEKPQSGSWFNIAYDSERDRIILFGGVFDRKYLNETWIYDYYTKSWLKTNPDIQPSPRILSAMAYDSDSDRVILFGGSRSSNQSS